MIDMQKPLKHVHKSNAAQVIQQIPMARLGSRFISWMTNSLQQQ